MLKGACKRPPLLPLVAEAKELGNNIMAEFIELTKTDGEKVLANVEHIIKVVPNEKGSIVYFDTAEGNNNGTHLSSLFIADTYATVKKKLK